MKFKLGHFSEQEGSLELSRRNAPVKDIADTVSWVKGSHQFSFGGNFDQINLFQSVQFTSVMPQISMGVVNGDPIITGATNMFSDADLAAIDRGNAVALMPKYRA